MDSVLRRIVDLVHDPAQPDQQARTAATRMLLDAVGCALGGYRHSAPAIARSLAAQRPDPNGAHVLGLPQRVDPEIATFANGAMIRFLDLNDAYGSTVGIGHPSDYIAAVLAGADMTAANGKTTLDAIVLSYEVFCRLTDLTRLGVERWDHVINGSVASAASAAYLLRLTPDQLGHAIALALVPNLALQASRLNGVSMWKGYASGNAARNGVFAARLAQAGVTGPATPFEGRGGLFDALGHEPDLDAWERPRWAIHDCHVKRYAAGYFAQSAIQAALEARGQISGPSEVDKVEVGTFEFAARVMAGDADKWSPQTRETADHSLPYVVAHALSHGSLTPDSYTEAHLSDPETARVLNSLTVHVDPDCERAWPEACMSRVIVRLTDGSRICREVRNYPGHKESPLDHSGLEAKFRGLVDPLLGPRQSALLADRIWNLESEASLERLFAAVQIPASDAAASDPG